MLSVFLPLKKYLLENRWYIAIGLVSVIIVDTLQLCIPRIIKYAVDALTSGIADSGLMLTYAGIVLITAAWIVVFRFTWRFCIIGTSRRIERDLRNHMFSHILRQPIPELLRMKTGDVMARMTNDLEAVRMCTGIGWVALMDTVFLGLAAIGFMIYISPLLTAVCMLPLLLIVAVTWRLSRVLHVRFGKVQKSFSALTEKVRESVEGIAIIKAYSREQASINDFAFCSNDYVNKNMSLVYIIGLFFPLIIFFSNLSIGVLVWWGGRMTVVADISTGDFVAFASYLWIVTWPMMALGWVVNLFQRGKVSMGRILELLDAEQENYAPRVNAARRLQGHIEVSRLTFSYERGSRPVLDDVSFTIEPGETIGITGKTGSGKTTLCDLLLRFFCAPEGTLKIDGMDIASVPLEDLRPGIAYVPQDSFLFSDSIFDNLSFGVPHTTEDAVRISAERAFLTEEILGFQDGFETMIGEKGVTLSGGQRQRMCIARALLLQAPILIIDDALSALDVDTTEMVVESLKSSTNRCTSIIVANRIASIRNADRIYVFDEGRI
ncbi:MAG: ABC transporter ATP-binding protein, partial [Deltaproteobacteria bacterium]|nr:ABC transporter ATP-binding protein [Deltaproteobacteria bacterium]